MGKFLKHIETGTFHEVEDDKATLAAYPGQYEAAKSSEASGASKAKLGFGTPEVGKWADGTEADTTTAAAPATPIQTNVGEVSDAGVKTAKAPGPSVAAMQAKAATEAKAAPELKAPAPAPKVAPAK